VGSLTGAFLAEEGYYATYQDGATAIFINKTTLTRNDLVDTLTHELGHAVGSTLTAQDWTKFYQLRDIPSGTPQETATWNLSPAEDFAEVFKYTFTGIAIRTYYGLLVPSHDGLEFSCQTVYQNLYSSYAPQYAPQMDMTNPLGILNYSPPTSAQTHAIEAQISANPQMQSCRRKVMNNPSEYPADWELGTPYTYTVSQATKDFVNGIVNRLNQN
jgi:hypothetical protein